MHPAALSLDLLQRDCEVARTRGSGPGGQHRNKVETAIVVTHLPTKLRGGASERRSQAENLTIAWHRLRVELALHVREAWPSERAISPLWQERIRGGKFTVSAEHDDFPALIADLLDLLAAHDHDLTTVATLLGTSSSQLVKFLRLAPVALAQLNATRTQRGQRQLS